MSSKFLKGLLAVVGGCLLAGAAALLIAQLTISFQAVKAAGTDPAATLKFE